VRLDRTPSQSSASAVTAIAITRRACRKHLADRWGDYFNGLSIQDFAQASYLKVAELKNHLPVGQTLIASHAREFLGNREAVGF
jgi:hypothetical protein